MSTHTYYNLFMKFNKCSSKLEQILCIKIKPNYPITIYNITFTR